MVMQDDTEEPLELVLTLTPQTIGLLRALAGPDTLHADNTPEGLAVVWLDRWSRRQIKQLDYHDRFGPSTETMTIAVKRPLWRALREHGVPMRWWPEEVASAVLNDCGGRMAPDDTYGTLK